MSFHGDDGHIEFSVKVMEEEKEKKKKKDGGSCRGKAQSQGCVRGAAVAAMDHSSSADG